MLKKSSVEVKNMFTYLRMRIKSWAFVGRLIYLRITK
jgi:hypothetical protein